MILSLYVPYPPETSDSIVIQHRMGRGADCADQIVDEFDEMLRPSERYPLVCPIALHTFLGGRPFRLRHLRRAVEEIHTPTADKVWFVRAGDIADHALSLSPGVVPRSEHTRAQTRRGCASSGFPARRCWARTRPRPRSRP